MASHVAGSQGLNLGSGNPLASMGPTNAIRRGSSAYMISQLQLGISATLQWPLVIIQVSSTAYEWLSLLVGFKQGRWMDWQASPPPELPCDLEDSSSREITA